MFPPLLGYADRLSVRPGETINFHVSNVTSAEVQAHLARVISADPNPNGPGIKIETLESASLSRSGAPKEKYPTRGSFARIVPVSEPPPVESFTCVVTIWPTKLSSKDDQLLMIWNGEHGVHFAMWINDKGMLEFEPLKAAEDDNNFTANLALREREWATIAVSYESTSRQFIARIISHDFGDASRPVFQCERAIAPVSTKEIYIAGAPDLGWDTTFNGKIERPMIFGRALSSNEIAQAMRGESVSGLIAAWDFSKEMHSNSIVDVGPYGFHGTLHNAPTRAVRGSTWTGREQCFRHAPDEYAAIHFHDDDIDDCHWPITHSYTVPKDVKSGAYALMLEAGAHKENLPFFVVPPKGKQSAKLAILVSTFTYTVYGNHARPEWTSNPDWKVAWIKQAKEWGAYPHNPGQYLELGLSTYNHHTDGSGIAMASWHRPMLNLRIGYLTYPYPDIRASGLRHYPADSHLLAWLEHNQIDYDLITDWELHHEGLDLLKQYTCIMTGSHPEYHTGEMLDALEAYTQGGGRFMYMGGNGFYWKIALSPDKPGLIEIRRAEGGIRAWAAEPGEYYNQFDGEYGGLWRRNARPPQKLCGVGFTAQGNFVGSYYRVKDEARADPRTAWIFDGITDDIIGNFGLSGHGAAGFELDRADTRLGTPLHAIVIAQSENHPPEAPWVLVPEEQLTHITTFPGKSHKDLIRADMTLFETPNNGCVFSTGSITFCGSLPHNGFDNNVSRLVKNVLARFMDPNATFRQPSI